MALNLELREKHMLLLILLYSHSIFIAAMIESCSFGEERIWVIASRIRRSESRDLALEEARATPAICMMELITSSHQHMCCCGYGTLDCLELGPPVLPQVYVCAAAL